MPVLPAPDSDPPSGSYVCMYVCTLVPTRPTHNIDPHNGQHHPTQELGSCLVLSFYRGPPSPHFLYDTLGKAARLSRGAPRRSHSPHFFAPAARPALRRFIFHHSHKTCGGLTELRQCKLSWLFISPNHAPGVMET